MNNDIPGHKVSKEFGPGSLIPKKVRKLFEHFFGGITEKNAPCTHQACHASCYSL